jgi:hypothetical protein
LHISFVGREDLHRKSSPDNLFFISDLSEIVDFLVGPETVLTTTFDDFSAFDLFVFVTTAFTVFLLVAFVLAEIFCFASSIDVAMFPRISFFNKSFPYIRNGKNHSCSD